MKNNMKTLFTILAVALLVGCSANNDELCGAIDSKSNQIKGDSEMQYFFHINGNYPHTVKVSQLEWNTYKVGDSYCN